MLRPRGRHAVLLLQQRRRESRARQLLHHDLRLRCQPYARPALSLAAHRRCPAPQPHVRCCAGMLSSLRHPLIVRTDSGHGVYERLFVNEDDVESTWLPCGTELSESTSSNGRVAFTSSPGTASAPITPPIPRASPILSYPVLSCPIPGYPRILYPGISWDIVWYCGSVLMVRWFELLDAMLL